MLFQIYVWDYYSKQIPFKSENVHIWRNWDITVRFLTHVYLLFQLSAENVDCENLDLRLNSNRKNRDINLMLDRGHQKKMGNLDKVFRFKSHLYNNLAYLSRFPLKKLVV